MKSILVIAILALLFCSVARAQDKPQTPDAARREKAVDLLQSLAAQLPTLQSAENRARIGANIADSLWAHDEKRARALFISIEEDINWGLRAREVKNVRDDYSSMVFMKLRYDIVMRIAKHDAELALDFLRATAPTNDKRPQSVVERERNFELELATQIVASNPDLALKIGRQSLDHGLSNNLLPLLKQLHKKHREHGITLYKETVRALRESDFSHDRWKSYFARALAENFTPPVADESAFRDFMELWISTAVANGCSKSTVTEESAPFCDQVRILLPQMQKIAPQQTAQLKRLAIEDTREAWARNSGYAELYNALNEDDFDEALELAKKNPELEAEIYWRTAVKAMANGDTERALKIANDFSGDPQAKQRLLAEVKAYEAARTVTDEQLAQVQTELDKLPQVEDQIRFLADLAARAGGKNRPAALKLLDQATGIAESMKSGKDQMTNQLMLALSYCAQKSDRGLAMMESLIPRLNEMVDAAVKLDEFETHYLRDGEWNMSANGPLGEVLTYLSQNAAYYAWTDFDRAVNLAAQFDRSEIRMMAQTKLAQSILAGPPKRFRLSGASGY
jgi:hypothetical protein